MKIYNIDKTGDEETIKFWHFFEILSSSGIQSANDGGIFKWKAMKYGPTTAIGPQVLGGSVCVAQLIAQWYITVWFVFGIWDVRVANVKTCPAAHWHFWSNSSLPSAAFLNPLTNDFFFLKTNNSSLLNGLNPTMILI